MKVNERLISLIVTAVLILTLGFIYIFSYRFGWQWLDSDISSGIVLGRFLADENVILSAKWIYGNEIHIIHQTMFMIPLFKLFGHYENWALIRSLTILLNHLVLLLSYIFLMKSLKLKTIWILISGLFLLMPISPMYWDSITFSGSYILFIAQLFFCLGFFVRLVFHPDSIKPSRINLIFFLLFSFFLGVYGIRSFLVFYIPLLLSCAYLWFWKKKFPLLLGCGGFIACCAGYVLNHFLHVWFTFASFEGAVQLDSFFSNFLPKLGRCLAALPVFFGFSAGSVLLSVKGFFSVISIFIAIAMIYLICKIFRAARLQNNAIGITQELSFVTVFFVFSLAFNIFVFIIISHPVTERFFVPFMVFYIPLAALFFEYSEKHFKQFKRWAIICGISLFVIAQGCLNFMDLRVKDSNSLRQPYMQYLLDNDLDYGFATHWNANVTSELSNGKVNIAGLQAIMRPGASSNMFLLNRSLIPSKYFNPLFHPEESFLLLNREEWTVVSGRRVFSGLKPDYEDANFIILRFPSSEIIHRDFIY